jgi:hypothetical protein
MGASSSFLEGHKNVEESRFLRYLTDRYNSHIIQTGEAPVLDDLVLDALEDRKLFGEQAQAIISASTNRRARSRAGHLSSVRTAIRRLWGSAFAEFDTNLGSRVLERSVRMSLLVVPRSRFSCLRRFTLVLV